MLLMSDSKAILVAKYFIWKNQTEPQQTGLGKLKLQKLIYYAQAWNLVLNRGQKLFDEDIQAWVHGPAVPSVFQYFRNFDFSKPQTPIDEKTFDVFSKEEKDILDVVWKVYGKYDGSYLETLSHAETPWQQARGNMDTSEPSQNVISTDAMKEFYGGKIETA